MDLTLVMVNDSCQLCYNMFRYHCYIFIQKDVPQWCHIHFVWGIALKSFVSSRQFLVAVGFLTLTVCIYIFSPILCEGTAPGGHHHFQCGSIPASIAELTSLMKWSCGTPISITKNVLKRMTSDLAVPPFVYMYVNIFACPISLSIYINLLICLFMFMYTICFNIYLYTHSFGVLATTSL